MTSLWFVLPACGRLSLAEVCLRQLARTCETLTENGLHASAVIVADDENLDIARSFGFATVERDNHPLGRKWNDGYELAGRTGVTHVCPLGTDDWIDPEFILGDPLPADAIRCNRLTSVVREDCERIATLRIPYDGGDGIRIIPTAMLEPLRYRPADEDRRRAIDTSVLQRISHKLGRLPRMEYFDLHGFQVVDFKSREQLNSYKDCLTFIEGNEQENPFGLLANHYPAAAIADMRALTGVPV